MLNGETEERRLAARKLDEQLLDLQRPAVLIPGHPSHPAERLQRDFEQVCILLEGAGCHAPHLLTTARFYHRLDHQERIA